MSYLPDTPPALLRTVLLGAVLLGAALLLVAFPGSGPDDGREGNRHYEREAYEDAAAAYRRGLSRFGAPSSAPLYWGLQHNLGSALHQLEQYTDAGTAFANALRHAPSDTDFARSAYNAGNTAVAQDDREAALAFYRRALLADPTNADARYNYEFVKRELDSAAGPDDTGENEEPGDESDAEGEPGEAQPEPTEPTEDGDADANRGDGERQDERGEPTDDGPPDAGDQAKGAGERPQDTQPSEPLDERRPMSQAEAQRILQALELDERNVLREALRRTLEDPREADKDW